MLVGRQHKARLEERRDKEERRRARHRSADEVSGVARSGGDVRVLSADLDQIIRRVTSAPLFGAQRVEHALRARIGGVEAEGDEDVVPRELEAVEA